MMSFKIKLKAGLKTQGKFIGSALDNARFSRHQEALDLEDVIRNKKKKKKSKPINKSKLRKGIFG